MRSDESWKPLVLVVDDNHDAADTLVMLIRMDGLQAVAARSVVAARLLMLHPPDLVLLDHQLLNESGLNLLGSLAKAQIEVVVLTSCGDLEVIAEALRRGAIGYLQKPIDIEVLGAVLDRARVARVT